MSAELPPRYDPKAVEGPRYAAWLASGAFKAPSDSPKPPFVIAIPPPNVTGNLHMGHALNNTLQDLLIRWKRMQGFNACWIPGTDHASISTTVMVERDVKEKEGKSRHDLGREEFLKRVKVWQEKHGSRIIEQLKVIGCSCDWDRLRFTLDEGLSKAVTRHFIDCHKAGLIYRGERIVNWCPRCRTALSDLENKRQERNGSLWHLRYLLKEGGEVILATTRPETLLGDTAVAVHPEDERHQSIIGKTAILPLLNREIPVIADSFVDKTFGTGVVKITPGHDPADFEVGQRHRLPTISIMNPDATLNDHSGSYAGMDRFKARDKIVADLEAAGLLVKVEPHKSAVGTCERCATVLEPIISNQWYMKMDDLAKQALAVVERGTKDPNDPGGVRLLPANQPAIFAEWMNNIQDWCISRQLWYGHRIPAWHCSNKACGEITISETPTTKCPKCGGAAEQDPDTLDTWFSSCLWPFSTLGWPEATEQKKLGFEKLYPTSVLITGSDIIFFWVARMIMMGLKHTGKIPFRTVIFNSLITDPEGKKMSKTKGNVVDPLELFDQYGTDAVRFALTSQESLKQSFRLTPDRVEHSRNFMNKIWNAARFSLAELEGFTPSAAAPANLSPVDHWILESADLAVESATGELNQFSFNEYAGAFETFFWTKFCDVYLELAKPALKDPARKPAAQWTLWKVLDTSMRLLHPVAPYISEEIWGRLPKPSGEGSQLITAAWPKSDRAAAPDHDRLSGFALTEMSMSLVSAIRSLKHEMGIDSRTAVEVGILRQSTGPQLESIMELGYVTSLCHATVTPIASSDAAPKPSISTVIPGFTVYLKIEKPADPAAEKARLMKEQDELQALLLRTRATLGNADYLAKAPPELVAESRKKAEDFEARLIRLAERLRQL